MIKKWWWAPPVVASILMIISFFPQSQERQLAAEKLPAQTISSMDSVSWKKEKKEKQDSVKEEENRGDFVALKRWVGLMQQQIKEKGGMNQLILELKHLQLDPVIAKDSNPYTGDMHIIRTYKSLPGTRYFHAQYFSEKGGKPQLQHVSFEFRPGPGALKDVVSTLQKTLPEIGVPTEEDKEFYQWHFASDYVLWVKQLGKEDLIGDSFNAYSPDDLGTIRIALELEIHSDDHHASN